MRSPFHLSWGKHRENGIWRASTSRRRVLWRNHDALYVARGRWRLRPDWPTECCEEASRTVLLPVRPDDPPEVSVTEDEVAMLSAVLDVGEMP